MRIRRLALFGQSQKSSNFFLGGRDPPVKSAAVAASASQDGTLKPSRPLSRPPWVGSTWAWTRPGTGREALGPGLGLAGDPGWRPWPEPQAPGPAGKRLAFLFGGGQIQDRHFWQGLPASPWPGTSQVLPTPGGRDSGRLGLSVRTWLAEAATAADFKGGLGGRSPPS